MALELKTVLHQYTVVNIINFASQTFHKNEKYLKANWSWKMDEK